jgi:hypothetical protein
MEWVVLLLMVAALIGAAPAGVARRRGHGAGMVLLVLVLMVLGVGVLAAGALALMFNGYVEGYGSEPGRTLDVALPLLGLGFLLGAVAWYIAGRGRRHG